MILLQFMYPLDRAVPRATLAGVQQGWRHETELAAAITKQFDATNALLKLEDKTMEVPLKYLGAEPQSAAMIAKLTEYPFWQRYLPFSVFFQHPVVDSPDIAYTNQVAQEECRGLAREFSYEPINARLELTEDGALIATDEKDGRRVDPSRLCKQIQQAQFPLGETTTIDLVATTTPPKRTQQDFAAVKLQAEAALAQQVIFRHDEQTFEPSVKEIAGWLVLAEGEGGDTTLRIDQADVKRYLETINKTIGKKPGTTHVQVVNGVESSRTAGKPGKQVDYNAALESVQSQLLQGSPAQPIFLTLVDVKPTVMFNNRYTSSEEGLQAYVNDAARDYNAHIMVRQLGGERWEVGARQFESIPSASTYKVYVAMWLFDQMKQGKTSWNAPMLDTTVSGCFDRMTIASTNECARAWLDQSGRDGMNQYLYDRGFSRGTTFTSPIAVHTTAADLTNYMTRLERGELYDDVYRDRLYQSLGSHPYRYGVPVGSSGQVYDKVGFLWDYVHDTAVVRHSRGTYVVTIMTKGQSYARIASISREIERIMYP